MPVLRAIRLRAKIHRDGERFATCLEIITDHQRADERYRADRLAARLRELGVEPD
jgi:hypothetical protein